jgi:hypothetical protein
VYSFSVGIDTISPELEEVLLHLMILEASLIPVCVGGIILTSNDLQLLPSDLLRLQLII